MAQKNTKKNIEVNNRTELVSVLPTELQINPDNRELILDTCKKVELTREKCLVAIKEALVATKIILNKFGEVIDEEPDHDKRLKAATMGLEVLGDIKGKDVQKTGNVYNTVVYQWKKS